MPDEQEVRPSRECQSGEKRKLREIGEVWSDEEEEFLYESDEDDIAGVLEEEEEQWLLPGSNEDTSEDDEGGSQMMIDSPAVDRVTGIPSGPSVAPAKPPKPVLRDFPPPDRPSIPFTASKGLLVEPPPQNSPYSWFQLLFTTDLLSLIIDETNKYAPTVLQGRAKAVWHDLVLPELEIFLGLLFLMGIVPLPSLQLYWKRLENIFDFPCFYNAMSRDRFFSILRCLQFGTNPESDAQPQDPLYKIQPLLNVSLDRLKKVYSPGKELILEESMLLRRGRLSFGQNNQMKRHKYGVRLYTLTEPNGYVLDLRVYCAAKDPNVGSSEHREKVVLEMMERYLGYGHSLYTYNLFTSVDLAMKLYNRGTYTTGTLKKLRQRNPLDVDNKNLSRGESVQQFSDDGICVMKWHDRHKVVLMLSSEFSGSPVTGTEKGGKHIQKPEMVAQYKKHTRGVDRADQLLAYYPLERKTLRWYLKVGIHVFHILFHNAYLLYNKYTPYTQRNNTLEFRTRVIQTLISKNSQPTPLPVAPSPGRVHLPSFGRKQIRCQECSKKGKRKMVKSFCQDCTRIVRKQEPYPIGLCIENCFRAYHNY